MTESDGLLAGSSAFSAEARRWPWLGACAGWLVGGASAGLATWAGGLDPSRIFGIGALGAVAGGLAGLGSVGWLRLLVDRGRRAFSGRSGRTDLWDPWLDEGQAGRRLEGADEIAPARALVRPRVFSPDGGSFCLEDEIHPFAKGGVRGSIQISGPPGSGKSTALRHLLASLPPELGVRVLDEPDAATLAELAGLGLVVYAANDAASASTKDLASFRLAPWGKDEWIEYLLAVAGERCASVMARLEVADDHDLIERNPELWRVVLDRMIADNSISSIREALRRELSCWMVEEVFRERVGLYCLGMMDVPIGSTFSIGERDSWRTLAPTLAGLIRHRAVQLLVAADRIVVALGDASAHVPFLTARLPIDLIRESGRLIRDFPAILARLAQFVDSDHRLYSPMAASLLHASSNGWRPAQGSSPRLSGAYLDHVEWPCIALPTVEMDGVGMDGASLVRARLDLAMAHNARLRGANLSGASLEGASLIAANLGRADLSALRGDGANFRQANLEQARLESASLRAAWFSQAYLSGARFNGADLTGASLEDAIIDGADFSGANLESAILRGLTLSKAVFNLASFAGADLSGGNLEGMELPKANFAGAKLNDALLTGSILPNANFRKANLRNAGLAEVEWEGACLAGADLRGASFHMGSSRSGLVNSPIASEGSRTGFYTDDFNEQDFKSPEEIRKANLRGADLRGANIEGVDFYLVDLRGATLDPTQANHLRRSGAILQNRVT